MLNQVDTTNRQSTKKMQLFDECTKKTMSYL